MPTDAFQIALIDVFRREFAHAPDIIGGVEAGDTRRSKEVSAHLGNIFSVLHHHHAAEDDLLWPMLRARVSLSEQDVARMQDEHAAIVRQAIALGRGVEIRTEGDAFFAAFPSPAGAVRIATAAQQRLADHAWADGLAIRIRIGMHTGEGPCASPSGQPVRSS